MTARDYIVKELKREGVTAAFADELISFGIRPCLAWAVGKQTERMIRLGEALNKHQAAKLIADMIDDEHVTADYVSNNLGQYRPKHPTTLAKTIEYEFIKSHLSWAYVGLSTLWDDLLPYVWANVRRLVAVRLIKNGWRADEAADVTNLSRRTVYYLKKKYDTKSDT